MSRERKSQYGSLAGWLALALVAVIIGGLVLLRDQAPLEEKREMEELYLPGTALFSEDTDRMPIQLFFPDKELKVRMENREIYKSKDPVNRLRQTLVLLLHGPRSDDLFPLFAKDVRLRELYLREGCAYIDFKVTMMKGSGMGCFMEHLALTSIRDSLMTNFSEVEKVKILVNGQESETLFGHIDIRRPLPGLNRGDTLETSYRDF